MIYSGMKNGDWYDEGFGFVWIARPSMKGGHTHNHKQNHYNHCATSKMCRRLCREENLANWNYKTWEHKCIIYTRKATKRQK